jgi:quinohemoprotein ethanol dehydrogenase
VVPDRPRLPGRLLVFALDGSAKAPQPALPTLMPANITGEESRGDPVAGLAMFNDTCMVCHGFSAASGWNADLRRSAMLGSREGWRAVVIEGALKSRGMVSFGQYLTPAQAEDIRAYVRTQAVILARREAARASSGSTARPN